MTLAIDKVELIEGVTVYDDHRSYNTFYCLPNQPFWRLDPNTKTPVLALYKYRNPIDRADGPKGGGWLLFDIEFVVPKDKLQKIKEKMQERVNKIANQRGVQPPPVKIGTITYTKGTAKINLEDSSGNLVEKINNAGKPSFFGNNVLTCSMELTPEGATLFEEALKGKGPSISVIYDVWFKSTMASPIKVTGRFNASAFYSFYQSVDTDWHLWGEDEYRETIRERLVEREALSVTVDDGGLGDQKLIDQKLIDQIRDWATRTVEDAAERKMIEAIAPVSEDDRKVPEGIEDVTRNISNTKISSFTLRYTERTTFDWNIAPQGAISGLGALTDGEGNPLNFDDYIKEIDLDDPFFKQLKVAVHVNADFEELPLNSVEVKVNYEDRPMHPGEHRFTDPDDVGKFASYIENDNWEYTYSYQINYTGESQIFQSEPIKTDESILTIGVDDIGILNIAINAGDLNFEQISQALVTVQYEDSGIEPIEQQFILDENNRSQRLQEVIFQPRRKPYQYKVKYFMADGKEIESSLKEGRAPQLYIDDPFSNVKTVGLRASGDLAQKISTIFLDLTYTDSQNQYTQTESIALSQNQPFFDWTFPVIDENLGVLKYSGTIQYTDGTSALIEPTETSENTIFVGDKISDILEIEIVPDLLPWSDIKLVKLAIVYDLGNGETDTENEIFTPDKSDTRTVKISLNEGAPKEFSWSAQYYMQDGSKRDFEAAPTTEEVIILELPAQ